MSVIFAWLSLKFLNKKYLNVLILSYLFLVITLFTLITKDRSYVYKDNETFTKAEENSPSNVYKYSFTIPIAKAMYSDDESAFYLIYINVFSLSK